MRSFLLLLATLPVYAAGTQAPLRVLAFYSTRVEADHVEFAEQAVHFYECAAQRNHYELATTTNWTDLNAERLQGVDVVLWLNDSPRDTKQRAAFEQYMEHGGAWIGFHAAGYNDASTGWTWFVRFLGGAVFYGNNWPPLPAVVDVDDSASSVTRALPRRFVSPDNEWYSWLPDPRANPDVKVLLTLDKSNYPLGLKDTITGGDVPVVWTNVRYKMLYINMGHGDKIFTSAAQNRFFVDALRRVGRRR